MILFSIAMMMEVFMDFINELQQFFVEYGFQRLDIADGLLWIKEEGTQIKLIEVIPELLPGQNRITIDQQEKRIQDLEKQLMIRFAKKIERLTLMLFKGIPEEQVIKEITPYPNIWCMDKTDARVFVYENQRSDFYGLKNKLEHFMIEYQKKERLLAQNERKRMFRPVNTVLVVLNFVVFFILSLMGDVMDASFMADYGAMVWDSVMEQGQWFRLLTSTFMHFGMEHLTQNMLILLLIGARLERILGGKRYAIIYLGSGIAASLSSLFFTLAQAPYTVSAGASGAIFGVMGGLLWLILKDVMQKRRRRIQEIGLSGVIFMIVSALSYGFMTTGVDNAAHVGGLIFGFLLTGILSIRK